MSKKAFHFPVQLDDQALPNLKELQLYVKDGPNGQWVLKAKAAPWEKGFNCHLDQDGEYWFSVVTIDQNDRAIPADWIKEPPGYIVVLDTVGPRVDLKMLAPTADGLCVVCDVHDANPNIFLTHFEYQTADMNWHTLEAMPNRPGCFCVPAQAQLTGMVRVTAPDLALNSTIREFNLTTLDSTIASTDLDTKGVALPVPHAVSRPASPPSPTITKELELPKHQETTHVRPVTGTVAAAKHVETPAPTLAVEGNWPVVNDSHIKLRYKVVEEGQSGVGKVEVWVTKDNGHTWNMLYEDRGRTSTVEFDLPGDGVYGIRLVAANGGGFGAVAPAPGDAPEFVVELDTTKPKAELVSVKKGPANEIPYIEIAWQVEDKNIGSSPVDLLYGANPNGPWTPIAKNLASGGKYPWYPPREIGDRIYVKLVATDRAGNVTRCQTADPVAMDDKSRPRPVILSIEPSSSNMTSPIGN
jgi:hypothetical protein